IPPTRFAEWKELSPTSSNPMKPVISVQGLSKKYRIRKQQESFPTLRDALVVALRSPARLLNRNGNSTNESIWALKDVSFEVMPGETVGLIGKNGAGKSTLLKILSRITEPTEGRTMIWGRVASMLEV